ncbi:MAG: 5'/3'-nucleotidase SurE [Chlamydiales bacterium]|nr:5'/3'-nucleotidase SurE [Chlamydiales bacterium]
MKPHLLLTNDDGIEAPGLHYLWESLHEHFEITIVAPASEQSSIGMSITTRSPLRIQRVRWDNNTPAWSVTGTPADCVKLARRKILTTTPTLVVAGINRGSNAGRNVLYSGTVGGVIEGLMTDIPGIAFSTGDYEVPDYQSAQPWLKPIIERVLSHPLPMGTLLNVNFPKASLGPYRGIKMTRQGKEHIAEDPFSHDEEGTFWLGARLAEFDEHEESDIHWLNQGYVTAAPIHVHELTDHIHLKEHKEGFEGHFKL